MSLQTILEEQRSRYADNLPLLSTKRAMQRSKQMLHMLLLAYKYDAALAEPHLDYEARFHVKIV
jgi:hypothetical protein